MSEIKKKKIFSSKSQEFNYGVCETYQYCNRTDVASWVDMLMSLVSSGRSLSLSHM